MSRRSLLLFPLAPLALAALSGVATFACGTSDDGALTTAPLADAAPADGVAPIIVYDAAMPVLDATCNELPTAGPQVTTTTVLDAAAPVAAGGTIVDGTYALTALDWYNGDPLDQLPPTTSTSLVISGGGTVWQTAGTDASGGVFTINYAAIVDGDLLTLNTTCPTADTQLHETYTATGTTLSVLDRYGGEPYVRVYTME